ncbi:prepilin-type N-terminal cleavage/methylation domain-containing protein [bacterium]|nr:prepilin-type N-terminal cleavage/methylation domain-containing protein [bacterium]MBT3729918.1 prepilin-type N-terminal cleavage/methylation domain-containing protein [bacterium]MBT4894884.1 prepilin-type N-terminal cleavage/methylation domain-containing protein [bacterium]
MKHSKNKGFSLVELIASVAIFTIIMSVILVKHSEFSGTLAVENLAYDIALSIRKAQVFGLSVREFKDGGSNFNVGYGLHFDSSANDSYIFFVDANRNEKYDDSSEIIEVFALNKGNTISEFCTLVSSSSQKCSVSDITYLDIIFERPNPDAIIKSSAVSDLYTSAVITIASPNGAKWDITTITTGQISIQRQI